VRRKKRKKKKVRSVMHHPSASIAACGAERAPALISYYPFSSNQQLA
jgi:hypothetical protein